MRRCKEHEWFPDQAPSQFLPMLKVCLRCPERKVLKPSGQCLSGHPMADHYPDDSTAAEPFGDCPGPH